MLLLLLDFILFILSTPSAPPSLSELLDGFVDNVVFFFVIGVVAEDNDAGTLSNNTSDTTAFPAVSV
jgi:hypothetical protein